MRKQRTLRQRFADWLRYYVADRIDPDGTPRSAGATFTFEDGIGRVWHEGHHGPGCPVWYIGGEEDYRKAHTDAKPRPSVPSPYETGVCPECGHLVDIAWVDATAPGGPVERVPGRWMCRTVGCKYGEPGASLTITFEGTSATFGPIGLPHSEDPQ